MANTQPTACAPRPFPRRRHFFAIIIALPLLLMAAELTLRFFGWGGYPAWIREVGVLPSGSTLCRVEPAAAEPYFSGHPAHRGDAEPTNFLMPKPADTVRIFLVGESAAKGYPQPRNLAVSSFLQAMLADAWPDRRVEVLNVGTPGVASFPLVYQVRDALRFSPDLFIFYTGTNEFFGAYGAASGRAAGSFPAWALRGIRAIRGLALVQVLERQRHRGAGESPSLLEEVIGQTVIPADSPRRQAAARNLAANLGAMLDEVRAAGVPAIVCTISSNESGLAPLGQEDLAGLDEKQQHELRRLLGAAAEAADRDDFTNAVTLLREAVQLAPRHARARFLLGQVLARADQPDPARTSFLEARDLDTLPLRPTSLTEQALRNTALTKGAVLCDVAEIFRRESPDGATGWELLDDHVHLSLSGQALAARAMVGSMVNLAGPLQLGPDQLALVQDDETYATALGANFYDDYGVNHTLRTRFAASYMRRANPQAHEVFDTLCREAEDEMTPPVLAAVRAWQNARPPAGGRQPLAAMVASALLREGRTAEALELYETAARQVPHYTASYLEYVCLVLACRRQIDGSLDDEDLQLAADAIAQGKFLLANGSSESGRIEGCVGQLQQMHAEAEK